MVEKNKLFFIQDPCPVADPSRQPRPYIQRPRLSRLHLPQWLRLLAQRPWRAHPPTAPQPAAPYQFCLFRWHPKEHSYHHVDHNGNPLPHGRHRVALSGEVSFAGSAVRPEQVHLTFSDRADEMRVMFVCADAGKRAVRYGLEKEEEKGWTEMGTEVRTYEQKHMCDAPANDSVGWRDPGFVFAGLMNGLEPGRSNLAFQRQQIVLPVACPAEEPAVIPSGALFSMSSGDLLELDDKQWFGGMVSGSYYESLAQGMLIEPPDAGAWREDSKHSGMAETQTPCGVNRSAK
uniref:Putative inactive purple acid phosphatase 2 n=1 Tax=Aegilops tauschii TaxID=37682 RepID=M8C6Z7_AEGTA